MALYWADRVRETSTTTGTGTYSLGGAVTGFTTFVAGVGTGAEVHYVADDGTNWEVGRGTVTDATPDTLSRDKIYASSNSGSAVNWGSGTRDIRLTIPAEGWGPTFALDLPPLTGWSWVNQGSATVTEGTKAGMMVAKAISLEAPSNGTAHGWRIRTRTAPSTPYTITFGMLINNTGGTNAQAGIGWRSSSDGKLTTVHMRAGGSTTPIHLGTWTSATVFGATITQFGILGFSPLVWLRLADDGTNRTVHASTDKYSWRQLYSVARTTHHTPDEVFFGLNPYDNIQAMSLISYKEE